ncbi:MAG: ABC transporter permease [Chroococcidiopsidaceae cyanobacterium CP_BM_ER_R8_30]|nr:ABC transporter permease [Chroococcidiopsidaceae cyanobacterium CP_BM_ER_R8_30]
MVSLARKNLLEDIPRFLVAQAGIMFAVSLVTIQTGIFNGFTRSTTKIIDNSDADIWVASKSLVHLELTLPIPYSDVTRAQGVPGVQRAEALSVKGGVWRGKGDQITLVRIIGFDPNGQLFIPQNIVQGSVSALKAPYSVIVDTTNLNSLNVKGVGDTGKFGSISARIVGLTHGNRSIASNPFIFTSLENANAYSSAGQTASVICKLPTGSQQFECTNSYASVDGITSSPTNQPAAAPKPLSATDQISFILIRAQPGQNLQVLKQRLEAALPDTQAFTRKELAEKTETFWQQRTGIGFVLGLGAAVGIIVGVIIVGQILYSSVSDHLKEFGTLKAMGASDLVIYGVIVEQALWMAVLGYVPGIFLCLGLGAWTSATQGILVLITPVTAIAVLGVTVSMCVGSAVFAIQKVTRLDPAIVFKA